MTIETINNGESGKVVRDKINGNFGKSLNLDTTAGLQIGGAAPNAEQAAAVRAGIGANDAPFFHANYTFGPVVPLSLYAEMDGVTDDTAAFAEAMAATPEGGALYVGDSSKTIVVRAASGFVDRAIDLTGWSNRSMIGSATIKLADDVPAGVTIMRGELHNSVFSGFTLDGNVAARSAGAYGPEGEGLNPKNAENIKVFGVTVKNMHQDGFDFDDCVNAYLYKCRALDCYGDGYHMGGTVGTLNTGSVLEDCYSYNCGHERRLSDSYGEGFSLTGKWNKAIRCISENDARGFKWETSEGTIEDCVVRDCGDGTLGDVGFILASGGYGNTVRGNKVLNSAIRTGSVGFQVLDTRNVISGNYSKNNGTHYSVGSERNLVAGNTANVGTNGVLITGATGPNYIKGNTTTGISYGVRSDSANQRISENSILSPTEQGIDLRASGCHVIGNEVISGSKYGVRIFSESVLNSVIVNNDFEATSGGIIEAGTGNVIANNVVNGVLIP